MVADVWAQIAKHAPNLRPDTRCVVLRANEILPTAAAPWLILARSEQAHLVGRLPRKATTQLRALSEQHTLRRLTLENPELRATLWAAARPRLEALGRQHAAAGRLLHRAETGAPFPPDLVQPGPEPWLHDTIDAQASWKIERTVLHDHT